ncbi:MAG: hypothetical protein PHE67_12210 [Campylobacterales bacterium]|nr:hypothetical protein [Campylobacterales bacterium]
MIFISIFLALLGIGMIVSVFAKPKNSKEEEQLAFVKQNKTAFIIFGIVLLLFSGLMLSSDSNNKYDENSSTALYARAQIAVEKSLKDPDSAKFSNIKVFDNNTVCGEVNAKNSFGGYTGGTLFVWDGTNVYLAESYIDKTEFLALWAKNCNGNPKDNDKK